MYIQKYVYIQYMHICTDTYVYTFIHVCMYVYMCARTHMYVCAYTCVFVYTCVHVCI